MIQRRPLVIAMAAAQGLAVVGLPSIALAQAKLKAAAIYTVPFEQQWVGRVHKALKATENVANADYERVMREYATAGNQLIFGEAFTVEAAARKVAFGFPKTNFVLGSSGKLQAPYFSVFDKYIQEPAYLSDLVAGGMTKSNEIGIVGGFPIPEVNLLMNACMAGGKETNPKVGFSPSFVNSWFDPPKAKDAAFAVINKGADVLYAERFGVSDAAKEKGKLAIGNVIDTQTRYPDTVLASALWNFEPAADHAIKAAKEGKFVAEDLGPYPAMKYKGSELAPFGTFATKSPADLEGWVTMKADDSQPKSTAG